jgi:hypothetical protein
MEREPSLRSTVFSIEDRTMGNIQNCDSFTDVSFHCTDISLRVRTLAGEPATSSNQVGQNDVTRVRFALHCADKTDIAWTLLTSAGCTLVTHVMSASN